MGSRLAAKRAFYDEYRSVMDLSAEFYIQTIEAVFQEHLLPRGSAGLPRPSCRPGGHHAHRHHDRGG